MSHFIKDPLQTANNPLLPLGRLLPAKSPTYDIVYNRLVHFVVAPAFLAHPRLPHFRSMVASQTALIAVAHRRSVTLCSLQLIVLPWTSAGANRSHALQSPPTDCSHPTLPRQPYWLIARCLPRASLSPWLTLNADRNLHTASLC